MSLPRDQVLRQLEQLTQQNSTLVAKLQSWVDHSTVEDPVLRTVLQTATEKSQEIQALLKQARDHVVVQPATKSF